jgi:hypothetical protein
MHEKLHRSGNPHAKKNDRAMECLLPLFSPLLRQ